MDLNKKEYEKPQLEIKDNLLYSIPLDVLKEKLNNNASESELYYNMIAHNDKSLFNEQFVIDWQDRLNKVSITQKEDLV